MLGGADQLLAINAARKHTGKSGEKFLARAFHTERNITATVKLDARNAKLTRIGSQKAAQRAKGACTEKRKQTPRGAAQMQERVLGEARILRKMSGDGKTVGGVWLQIGVKKFLKRSRRI